MWSVNNLMLRLVSNEVEEQYFLCRSLDDQILER